MTSDLSASPTIFVLLRGLARSREHWFDFPDRLGRVFPDAQVLCFDLPGNGKRNTEKTPIDAKSIVRDLRSRLMVEIKKQTEKDGRNLQTASDLMMDSSIDRSVELSMNDKQAFLSRPFRVVLVGVSLGGMIALQWAQMYPGEISQTVVINSSLRQYSWFFQRLRLTAVPKLMKAIFSHSVIEREKVVLQLTSNMKNAEDRFLNPFVQIADRHSTSLTNFLLQLLLATKIRLDLLPMGSVENARSTSVISAVQSAPKILILASEKDRLVDSSCSKKLAKALNTDLVVHEWAGHDLTLDDPEWVLAVLQRQLIYR